MKCQILLMGKIRKYCQFMVIPLFKLVSWDLVSVQDFFISINKNRFTNQKIHYIS